MTVTPSKALLVAACVCFAVAVILETGTIHGSDPSAWADGGLLSLALGILL